MISDDDPDCTNSTAEENYVPDDNDFEPHKIPQAELNNLLKDKPEMLLSRLNGNNLSKQGVQINVVHKAIPLLMACFAFAVILIDKCFSSFYAVFFTTEIWNSSTL